MTNARLGDAHAKAASARQHLGIDEKAPRLRQNGRQAGTTKDLERAVAVAHPGPEDGSHKSVVAP
jgi:hypothetical protein